MAGGTLDLNGLVLFQRSTHHWLLFANYGAMLIPFFVFVVAAIAETNRLPFDLPEAESELVAGYHSEFSGFRWSLYMLAEWGNVLVVSSVGVTLFLGGWLRPFSSVRALAYPLEVLVPAATFTLVAIYCIHRARRMYFRYEAAILFILAGLFITMAALFFFPPVLAQISGLYWFFTKLGMLIYCFIWLRGTLPRVRYDQLMAFGWKFLIPLGIAGVALNAVLGLL
jgi:NADH-quinone oxidoreductase subunit H